MRLTSAFGTVFRSAFAVGNTVHAADLILDKAGTRCEHNCKTWAYAQRQNREVTVKHVLGALLGAVTLLGSAPSIAQTTLTIATVNNSDMIRMQALPNEFTAKNPYVTLKWVTLEENVLRQRVTTDI